MAKLQQLTSLYLWDTQITDAGVAQLKKALPKCKISRNATNPSAKVSAKVIEAAIRGAAKKPTGELTKADLEKVTELRLRLSKLTDVRGLERLTHLTSLSLGHCIFLDPWELILKATRVMDYFTENALKYLGFDWAAMVFTFGSLYLLGNKARAGFLLGVVANFFWFGYGFMSGSMANMLCSCVIVLLQIRGWHNWGRETKPETETA